MVMLIIGAAGLRICNALHLFLGKGFHIVEMFYMLDGGSFQGGWYGDALWQIRFGNQLLISNSPKISCNFRQRSLVL